MSMVMTSLKVKPLSLDPAVSLVIPCDRSVRENKLAIRHDFEVRTRVTTVIAAGARDTNTRHGCLVAGFRSAGWIIGTQDQTQRCLSIEVVFITRLKRGVTINTTFQVFGPDRRSHVKREV